MNIFDNIVINSILLLFPGIMYLLYLSTNKNIKNKGIYSTLSLITSFYLLYKFNINLIDTILLLHSVLIIAYLDNKYILANIFGMCIIILYRNELNFIWILIFIYVVSIILYILNSYKKINNIIFLEIFIIISSIDYYVFAKYNNLTSINSIISYIAITNITYIIILLGKKILRVHMNYKELQNEKQIRLSLFKITHEIKNPIAVCKGYLDMIDMNNTKQVHKYIPIIKSEIERLLGILQDYLLINKASMDLDIMDINLLLEDTIEKVNPLLREKNISLNLDIVDDEVYINGDYNRLSQVMINLLKNSIEAITTNIGQIKVKSKLKNNNYYIEVIDNGIGMSREVINKMKTPFFTTKKRGSGLGVSLIYEIVEAHGGKVKYSSEYGKGTKVTLEFPMYIE